MRRARPSVVMLRHLTALTLVAALAGCGGSDGKSTRPKTATRSVVIPVAQVNANTLTRKGKFWQAQPNAVRLQLASLCIPRAARAATDLDASFTAYSVDSYKSRARSLGAARVARTVDAYYADTSSRSFQGPRIDDSILDACGDAIGTLLQHDADAGQRVAERRQAEAERSVKPGHFRATTKLVKRYFHVDDSDTVRTATCAARTTCTVAFDTVIGDLGIIGDIVAGDYNRDYEAQLVSPIRWLYKLLFSDPKFQSGEVTAWIDVETQGGKTLKAPALTIGCDRAADRKIDWDNVEARGLQALCSYDLKPIGGLG